MYNQSITGDVAMSITGAASDSHHIPCVITRGVKDDKTFNQISQSAVYKEDNISVSITVCGGSYGGGSETLVVARKENDDLKSMGCAKQTYTHS